MASPEPRPSARGTMPDVVGLVLCAAGALIDAAGGRIARLTIGSVSGGEANTVARTDPGAGQPIGSEVTLVVYDWTP